ncbi:MAG: polysaccharide export protein [Lachnospiraceae bacterium]|nr:polysaccharide export protein [Lachnospiraceae bacterium]
MNDNVRNDEMEIDLREIFGLLISKWWIIVLTGVIFAGVFGIYNKFFVTPMYSSTTQLVVVGSTSTITSLTDLQIGSQLTSDYIEIVKSRPVVEKVIENLGLDMTYGQLMSQLSVVNQADTRILNITVTNDDPYMAKEIVDQFALVSKKRISDLMDIDEPGVLAAGVVNDNKVSPNTKKNTVLGGLIGVILCMGIIIVRFLLDDTIKSTDDIEKYLGLNTLAILPFEEAGADEAKREEMENKAYKKRKKQQQKEKKKNGGNK